MTTIHPASGSPDPFYGSTSPSVLVLMSAITAACGAPLQPSPTTPTTSDTAVRVLPASQMKDLVLSEDGGCGVFDGGTAKCWGTWQISMSPENVTAAWLSDVVELRIGDSFVGWENQLLSDFFCARLSTGVVQCWGNGYQGQLGLDVGAGGASMSPVTIEGIPPNVTGIALGEQHACAVTATGGVVCWGSNEDGQLGLGGAAGDKIVRPSPVLLPGKAVQVVASNRGTCALLDDGDVYCWGEAGDTGPSDPRITWWPKRVNSAKNSRQLSAGISALCALHVDGHISCWGHIGKQLGPEFGGAVAAHVPGIADATAVAVGYPHACAIRRDSTLWCWGTGDNGELGDGRRASSWKPVLVPLPGPVVRVTAGKHSTCARLEDHRWFCWGANRSGEIAPRNTGPIISPRLLDLSEL